MTRPETVMVAISRAHIAAMRPGPLRDEVAYAFAARSEHAAKAEQLGEQWVDQLLVDAEAVRAGAVERYADTPGVTAMRRAQLERLPWVDYTRHSHRSAS